MKAKTLFISDTHIGCKYCRIKEIISTFDKYRNEIDTLYLVGDIIDLWKLTRNWYWCNEYNIFIRKILRFAELGKTIYYVRGNHEIIDLPIPEHINLGNIIVDNNFIHKSPKYGNIYVTHGHEADKILLISIWFIKIADIMYDIILWLNAITNYIFCSKWSLARFVKQKIKAASNHITGFEKYLSKIALENKCNGVICGHIHTPKIIEFINDDKVFLYANIGDFMENCSYIIEMEDGTLIQEHGL